MLFLFVQILKNSLKIKEEILQAPTLIYKKHFNIPTDKI